MVGSAAIAQRPQYREPFPDGKDHQGQPAHIPSRSEPTGAARNNDQTPPIQSVEEFEAEISRLDREALHGGVTPSKIVDVLRHELAETVDRAAPERHRVVVVIDVGSEQDELIGLGQPNGQPYMRRGSGQGQVGMVLG